jgi:hypothetical protein
MRRVFGVVIALVVGMAVAVLVPMSMADFDALGLERADLGVVATIDRDLTIRQPEGATIVCLGLYGKGGANTLVADALNRQGT